MNCCYIKYEGARYFIPGCYGSAVWGVSRCTCIKRDESELTDKEIIIKLQKEIRELHRQLQSQKKAL